VGEYEEFFEKYAAEYDGVLLINLGSGFSSSHQNALIAAEDYPNIRCIDSSSLSVGQGLIVMKAAELAESCESLDALAEAVRAYIPKVEGSFVLDQLKFLVKGGRCSSLAALGANMLNLKPCISLNEGRLGVSKKYRGSYTRCLTNYVKERLEGREDLDSDTLFLVYTVDQPKETLDAVREAVFQYGNFTNVIEATAGCTISCHCGPGTLGLMYLKK
jgi:DegV family protein with EDD domain